jgi:hypothetical protein
MDIYIYVQSRGVSKDYCWLQEIQGEITDPPNLNSVIQIVDSEGFSLLLYRVNGQLSLLVTGLQTKNRTDNRTRRIRNSVLWVGKDSDEATLRKLAIQALSGDLAAKVDPAVVSENNAQGFTVNFDRLKPENLGLASVENNPADSAKIGNLSALKNDLIGDLKKYALPKHDGMLVVVCSTVSKSSLEREQVWRGLSDQISDDDWIELPVKGDKGDNFLRQLSSIPDSRSGKTYSQPVPASNSDNFSESYSKTERDKGSSESKKTLDFRSFIIGLVVGLILGVALTLLVYHPEKQLQQTIQTLENRVDQEIKAYQTFESEVENSYKKFIEESEKFKQDLEKELKALQNKSDELEPK